MKIAALLNLSPGQPQESFDNALFQTAVEEDLCAQKCRNKETLSREVRTLQQVSCEIDETIRTPFVDEIGSGCHMHGSHHPPVQDIAPANSREEVHCVPTTGTGCRAASATPPYEPVAMTGNGAASKAEYEHIDGPGDLLSPPISVPRPPYQYGPLPTTFPPLPHAKALSVRRVQRNPSACSFRERLLKGTRLQCDGLISGVVEIEDLIFTQVHHASRRTYTIGFAEDQVYLRTAPKELKCAEDAPRQEQRQATPRAVVHPPKKPRSCH
ncbi:hypothetical protein C8J57DRAFT_1403291 [Mycena rebaudengoi]|nr:hypothetical protein C8J57DRAFT_1408731 [Mycena rebaudengoi]KAJ7207415.1 hypothetical protein C8J57DRAFT_1403291 [Mycena rebaudengoi]